MMLKASEYNSLLYDILFTNMYQYKIAEKYEVSDTYVTQIKKRLKKLKHPVNIKDGKIICSLCNKLPIGKLKFHDNDILVCNECYQSIPILGEFFDGLQNTDSKTQKDIQNNINHYTKKIEKLMSLLKSLHQFMLDKMQQIEGKNLTQKDIINLIQEIEEIIK